MCVISTYLYTVVRKQPVIQDLDKSSECPVNLKLNYIQSIWEAGQEW